MSLATYKGTENTEEEDESEQSPSGTGFLARSDRLRWGRYSMNTVLQEFGYTCAKCTHRFRAMALPGDPYGMFLMRSESDEIAILDAFEVREYKEVSDMLRAHPRVKIKSDFERARVLQSIFGELCDPSPDGTHYSILRRPRCPECGSTDMAAWEPVDPPQCVDQDVPMISASKWQSMDCRDKDRVLDSVLNRLGV